MKLGEVLDSRWRVESVLHDGAKTTVVAVTHVQHEMRSVLKILRPAIIPSYRTAS